MLTHPTITASSVAVGSWRHNVVIVIMRWTLVPVIEEEAGQDDGVSVRVGQHKSDSHLDEKLTSISTLNVIHPHALMDTKQ